MRVRTLSLGLLLGLLFCGQATAEPDELEIEVLERNFQQAQTYQERDRLLGSAKNLLMMEGSDDPEMLQGAALLDFEQSRQSLLQGDPLAPLLDELEQNPTPALLRQLRTRLLARGALLARLAESNQLTTEDAERMLELARHLSQAFDDARDFSPYGGNESELARLARAVHSLSQLLSGVQNENAGQVSAGLRDLVSVLNRRVRELGVRVSANTTLALDLPAGVASAMIDVTRQGFDDVNEALGHVGDAIGGDQEAVTRAIEASRRVEETLSSRSFGRAILDSLSERLISRVPFLRTVFNLCEPTELDWLLGLWSAESGTAIRFVREADGTVSGRLEKLSPRARDVFKYRVGETVFRNWKSPSRPVNVWSHHVIGGEALWANAMRGREGESKYWTTNAVIHISQGKSYLQTALGYALGYKFYKQE